MQVAALAGALLAASAPVEAVPFAPFVVDHEHRADTLDMRYLLDRTAGERGFVQVRNGHLVTADGKRFRCWGVNLAGWTPGSALLPPHDSAESYAASLSKLGVNCVRFQFLDLPDSAPKVPGYEGGADPGLQHPAGLIDDTRADTKHFSPEQQDRLDYLVYQLKIHGIYVNFNLNVGRVYKEGDGVPDYKLIGNAKAMTYFGPEIVEREKEYARTLLAHVNPYTKKAYTDEPAVAIVEIVNENSLLEFWMRNWLRGDLAEGTKPIQLDLTPHYKKLLTDRYNSWLAQNRPQTLPLLRRQAHVGPAAPVPLMRRGDFAAADYGRFDAELRFLTQVEISFMDDMRAYLQTLGVKVPIIGSNDHTFFISGLPHLRTNERFAMQDSHVYWQHPAIYGKRGTPMVDEPEKSMPIKLARTAILGKPFTASEVGEPFPNDYGAEAAPILAAYGALQDWDGIFFYALEPKLNGKWLGVIGDYFDIAQDPVKIAELPLGANIFLRADVAAARRVVARTYSAKDIAESARASIAQQPYFTPNFPQNLPLVHGSRIRCLDCQPLANIADPTAGRKTIVSDTGELSWFADGPHSGLQRIVTARTEVLTGFVKKALANAGAATKHLSADIENDFAVIGVTALDDKPIATANTLLVVAVSKSTNSKAEWNERRSMLKTWGEPPTLIEPVTGWILLKDLDGAVSVTATPLDGMGKPQVTVNARMLDSGWEFPVGNPAATNYLVRVTR